MKSFLNRPHTLLIVIFHWLLCIRGYIKMNLCIIQVHELMKLISFLGFDFELPRVVPFGCFTENEAKPANFRHAPLLILMV